MSRPSRHDALSHDAGPAGEAEPDACPCCGETLLRDAAGMTRACETCGYPENNAAWVGYDGCS